MVLALVSVPIAWAVAYIDYDLYSRFAIFVTTRVVYFGLYVVLPVAVLVINVMLIREVRRASNNAANLGLHHPSTSSHSAVPTVTIIATSFVYVLLRGSVSITYLLHYLFVGFTVPVALTLCSLISDALSRFVFAYNFYVYLMTGRQFRSELRKLFDRCISTISCFYFPSYVCCCRCP